MSTRWAGRREVERLNPLRDTKTQGANRDVSEGKADLCPYFFSRRGPTRSSEREQFVGLYPGCTDRALDGWMLAHAPASPA